MHPNCQSELCLTASPLNGAAQWRGGNGALLIHKADMTKRYVFVNVDFCETVCGAHELNDMQKREISSERVKQRREELGLSQKQLAEIVGVTQQSIQVIERGGVRKPRFIAELADALKVPIATLVKDYPDTMPENLDANDIDLFDNLRTQIEGIQVAGFIEAGTFRRSNLYLQKAVKRVPLSIDNRYAGTPQYAWEVRGDGMDGIGIADGMLVVACLFDSFISEHNYIKNESIVIIERHRSSKFEIETSLKKIYYTDHGVSLKSESVNSIHENFLVKGEITKIRKPNHSVLIEGQKKNRTEQIEIIAVVLSATKLLNP